MNDQLNYLATEFTKAIPHVIGALLVLIVGYIVARLVKSLLSTVLSKTGLDKVVEKSPAGGLMKKLTPSLSSAIGSIAFWAVYLGTISLAVSVLGISALTSFVAVIYGYLPNVIAAFLILLVAGIVSAAIATFVSKVMGETATGKMVAGVVPGVIFSIAIFMALNQLQIAQTIVTLTYAAIIGSVALGSALAFGLGGREVAATILKDAHSKAGKHIDQAKQDLEVGKARSKVLAGQVKQTVAAQPASSPSDTRNFASAPSFGESMQSFAETRPKVNPPEYHDQ